MISEIWETRVSGPGAVIFGSATLFTAWNRGSDRRWEMLGSFWSRAAAEEACQAQQQEIAADDSTAA